MIKDDIKEYYVEFVPSFLKICFQSVQVLQEFDSKIQILYLLSVWLINLISIDVNSPEELNLLENGVLLWETTINHAPLIISQLLELFHYLVAMIEKSFDHLPIAMKIIEAVQKFIQDTIADAVGFISEFVALFYRLELSF